MLSTNFNEENGAKAGGILDFVLNNKYSDFYKKKYSGKNIVKITDYASFCAIPLLEKDEFSGLELEERTFVPESEIGGFAFSSGTTTGTVTIMSRSRKEVDPKDMEHQDAYYYYKDSLVKLGVEKVLMLLPVTSRPLARHLALSGEKTKFIPGDPDNAVLTAAIAKELGVDGIRSTATRLALFLENAKTDLDKRSIKWVFLSGEFCPIQRFRFLKEQFPNAKITFGYGSSDSAGARGFQCDILGNNGDPTMFHPTKFLWEVVDEENRVVPFGQIGELVYTTLTEKAFPTIRYKTGDMVSVVKSDCPCGNNYLMKVYGRNNFDYFKFNDNALMTTQSIEDALDKLGENIDRSFFQMHVFKAASRTGDQYRLELHAKIKNIQPEAAAQKIGCDFIITKDKKAAEKFLKLPISVVNVSEWERSRLKNPKIIYHRDIN